MNTNTARLYRAVSLLRRCRDLLAVELQALTRAHVVADPDPRLATYYGLVADVEDLLEKCDSTRPGSDGRLMLKRRRDRPDPRRPAAPGRPGQE